jgi:tRNA (mo5U34)-methyltransferase
MSGDELRAGAAALNWYHSIDLGHGVVTRGASTTEIRLTEAQLPDFAGRSVIDIGAWDGYYSFLAERNGADRVVALDHYVWGVDIPARDRYWQECRANGVLPDHNRDVNEFFHADLPGRRGFDFAHHALDSNVEAVVADFATDDLEALGSFDVALYLGVLYHMMEPLTCLQKLRAVTREVAVVETVALHIPAFAEYGLLEFFADGDLNRDYGNWYTPTITALRGLVLAAGFSRVETVKGPPDLRPASRIGRMLSATTGRVPAIATRYRAVVHAFV